MPLRNDHSLSLDDMLSQGFKKLPVSKSRNLNIPFEPKDPREIRCSQLSLKWGVEIPTSLLKFIKKMDDAGPVCIPWGDLGNYSSDEYLHDEYEYTESVNSVRSLVFRTQCELLLASEII